MVLGSGGKAYREVIVPARSRAEMHHETWIDGLKPPSKPRQFLAFSGSLPSRCRAMIWIGRAASPRSCGGSIFADNLRRIWDFGNRNGADRRRNARTT